MMGSAAATRAVQTSTVQCSSDQTTINAFLAHPADVKGQLSSILLIHEWWGLNDHIKDLARRFANEGYAVLAPNLYARLGHGVTTDAAEAAKWMESLSSQAALRDLNAAATHLKQQPFVDGIKIGTVGFCMGGTFVLMLATHNSDIQASVAFYGKVPPIETLRHLLSPVLYHYGAKDGWVTKQEVDRLQEGLKQYSKPGTVRVYPNAGHAFFNDTRPDAYSAEDATLAWQRTLAFFKEHLS